jgi:CheY-like chemotaxis protein
MIGRTNKYLLGLLLAVALAGGACSLRAEEPQDKTAQIEKLFREGVDLYQQGKYSEAQHKLRDALALDPRKELAARLVDEAGDKVMSSMMANVRMGNEPMRLWELYKKYYVAKTADKERMKALAKRLMGSASEDERTQIYTELAQLGYYAVPALAPYLKDAAHEDFRTYARIAIMRMSSRAVLPVIELLNDKDVLLRENACLLLADIQPADVRAEASLKARVEDAKEADSVKRAALKALEKISGLQAGMLHSAAEYYYNEANRYYLDRPGVAEEAEDNDGLVWHLDAAGELVSVQYPLWAWNDQMAEKETLAGMALAPDFKAFFPLWACVQAAQATKVKDLLDIAAEQPALNSFSSEEKKQIEDWDKKLVNVRVLVAAVGREYCNEALAKVQEDMKKYPGHSRLPATGVFLAQELTALDIKGDLLTPPPDEIIMLKSNSNPVTVTAANAPITVKASNTMVKIVVKPESVEITALGKDEAKVGEKSEKCEGCCEGAGETGTLGETPAVPLPSVSTSALVTGLDSMDLSLQYGCAQSLAKINRFPAKWLGSDKVAKILGRGMCENKEAQILVVEENHNKANEMREKLEKLGYGVSVAEAGREALLQARSFPPKDAVIVAENLHQDLGTEQLVEELRADVRTRYLPVGILHVQADRTAVQARFGTEVPLVERESKDHDLKDQVENLLSKRAVESAPKRHAHEIAKLCTESLAKLNSKDTYLILNDAVEYALTVLVNQPEDVRIPAVVFLGNVEGGSEKAQTVEKLTTLFLDAKNNVELRRAALRSLGYVKKEGLNEIYFKAQADADQEIKNIGAEALGQLSRDDKTINDFVHAERIDKAQKEN